MSLNPVYLTPEGKAKLEAELAELEPDEAAEFQGGVGTAGSANIGKRYAMFEAIHGSAPRMVTEGRAQYADPCSMIRAAAMMFNHIGFPERGKNLEMALDVCGQYEKKLVITGRSTGATGAAFTDYNITQRDRLESKLLDYGCTQDMSPKYEIRISRV